MEKSCYVKILKPKNCAIKSIHKDRLISIGKVQTVLCERDILMRATHTFIISLKFAFQTSAKFYLGLEYASGGELFYRMQNEGALPLDDVRIYIAQLSLALNYLHSLGIIYHDIKPENILLDSEGNIKLTDFGLAKDIIIHERTSTMCGTPEYAAPEVVNQHSYSYQVDCGL